MLSFVSRIGFSIPNLRFLCYARRFSSNIANSRSLAFRATFFTQENVSYEHECALGATSLTLVGSPPNAPSGTPLTYTVPGTRYIPIFSFRTRQQQHAMFLRLYRHIQDEQNFGSKCLAYTLVCYRYGYFYFILFYFFILRRMGKNKALAHHTSTYFYTRRVSGYGYCCILYKDRVGALSAAPPSIIVAQKGRD